MLVQYPATFEMAVEISDGVGAILAHTWYGKGSKKPKNKGKNPFRLPYHRADIAGGDADSVPMELGKLYLNVGPVEVQITNVCALTTLVLFLAGTRRRKIKTNKLS